MTGKNVVLSENLGFLKENIGFFERKIETFEGQIVVLNANFLVSDFWTEIWTLKDFLNGTFERERDSFERKTEIFEGKNRGFERKSETYEPNLRALYKKLIFLKNIL